MKIIKFEKLTTPIDSNVEQFYLNHNYMDSVMIKLKIKQLTHIAYIQTNNCAGMICGTENLKNELIEQGFIDDTKLISRIQK